MAVGTLKRMLSIAVLMLPLLLGCEIFKDVEDIDGAWHAREFHSNGDQKEYYVEITPSSTDSCYYKLYNMFNLGDDFCVHLVLTDNEFTIMGCNNSAYTVTGSGKLTQSDESRIDWEYSLLGPDLSDLDITAIYTKD